MKLILSAHNVQDSEAIEAHIQARLEKFSHYEPEAIEARVLIEHDTTKAPDHAFKCAMRLAVPGPDLFAEESREDLYVAIDTVSKKIEQQIRTRHSKRISKNHSEAARLKEERQNENL